MNRKKKIFESNTPLTKEEMDAYLKGDISQADKYQLEQKIAGMNSTATPWRVLNLLLVPWKDLMN